MPVVKTRTNRVIADDPEPDDLFVRVTWHGPDDGGKHLRSFDGPVLPIEKYQAAIDWATAMADYMRFPLYVVPMTGRDVLSDDRQQRAIAGLTGRERGKLRRMCVATLAEVLRDCDDRATRAGAFGVLVDMGVVKK